jgi:hypothetical protein
MADTSNAPLASFCHCAAIILLGETLERSVMRPDAIALGCVAVAIGLVALPLLVRPIYFGRWALNVLIAVGIAIGLCRLPYIDSVIRFPQKSQIFLPFAVLAGIAAALATLIVLGQPRTLVGGVFALLLLDVALMGKFHIDLSTISFDDVYVFQAQSCDALVHGNNPFAITFPDIYGPGAHFYPPGSVINGRVQSGYDYPPLTLLLDLPGYFAGDLRYDHLLAVLIAAGLIGYSQRNFAPAVLLLFTPRIYYVLENAWLETYSLLILAIVIWFRDRNKKWLVAIAAGLFLVTKQYLLLTVPAVALLLPEPLRLRESMRFALIALVAGSVVTLPFIFWNPPAFFHSMTVLFKNVLREDSISFLPIISRMLGIRLTLLCPLLAAVPPAILVLRRSPRSSAAFAGAVALVCLCVFAFSTQAFTNYYFFAVAALCAALAVEPRVTIRPLEGASV